MAADVRHKLQALGVDAARNKSLNRLPVDITDVYVVCASYQHLVDTLLTTPKNVEARDVMKIILQIEQHLYHHLPHHYQPLRKGLERLLSAIEPDEKRREEFYERYLNELTGRVLSKEG